MDNNCSYKIINQLSTNECNIRKVIKVDNLFLYIYKNKLEYNKIFVKIFLINKNNLDQESFLK